MSPQMTSLLILDDEHDFRMEIKEYFSSLGYDIHLATKPIEAFQILSRYYIDIVVIDIDPPEMNGIAVLQEIRRMYPDIRTIIMSGYGNIGTVISALRSGAADFFRKPVLFNELLRAIEKEKKVISFSNSDLADQFFYPVKQSFDDHAQFSFIAASPAMKQVVTKIYKVAMTKDTTVLITGENGTGKKLVAKGIHFSSERKDKPFYAVNCSSIPEELFESEFFGYNKGAFAGAVSDKPGWFELAEGGTLYLDEIGHLKPGLQVRLLRIMEEKEVCRLGSTSRKKIDVRVIAATNQDLEQLIEEKRFRTDLYYRINTFIINIPALRDCKESIPQLFSYYLEYYAHKLNKTIPRIEKDIMVALESYDFPGNVWELKHMIEKALIISDDDLLTLDHFYPLSRKLIKLEITVN